MTQTQTKNTTPCLISTLSTIYLWAVFWGLHTVVLLLQVVYCLAFFWLFPCNQTLFKFGLTKLHAITTYFFIWFNPFWYVSIHGKRPKVPKNSIIFSNHLCYVDAWVVHYAFIRETVNFVAMGKILA
eukprot:maker-scaffold_5-snap-gene-6.45-mRNA-1 protein AED:0.00 eAED:0.00 QI:105/1/1/1/0/0/2/608/126